MQADTKLVTHEAAMRVGTIIPNPNKVSETEVNYFCQGSGLIKVL